MKFKLRKYLNDQKDLNKIFVNVKRFKLLFRQIFEIFNEKQTTKRVIQHLQQKIFATNYATKFQKYVNFTK